jgi:hypothetical protein
VVSWSFVNFSMHSENTTTPFANIEIASPAFAAHR